MSQTTSEGAVFAKKGGNKNQGGDKNIYDKITDKKNFKCDKEGNPASHCAEGNKKYGKEKKSDDNKFRASLSRKSSKYDIGKIKNKMRKTFTTLEANIDKL